MLLALAEKIVNVYFASIPRRMPNAYDANKIQLIAHRGAHDNCKGLFENTLEAFRLAQKAGCWGIELDVHATADNVLVVNHDPTLKRLWGHDIAISQLTFDTLRVLVPGVPSLAEVVAEFAHTMHLFIELKSPFQDEEALEQTLHGLVPCINYHILSLDPAILGSLSRFPKESLLLVAVLNNVKKFCNLSIQENYGGVMGSYLLITNKRIRQLNAAHQHVGVGFVDSKNSLSRESGRGIHWIFTNQAVAVSQYLLTDPG